MWLSEEEEEGCSGAAWRSGGRPIPENTQDQFRQDSEPDVVEDVPRCWTRRPLKVLSNLQFCDSVVPRSFVFPIKLIWVKARETSS